MDAFLLKRLSQADQRFGNKARNLSFLIKKGFTVPEGLVVQFKHSMPLDAKNTARLREQLESLTDVRSLYVVRSSANVEDSSDRSFAGQFETVLNLSGADQILSALEKVAGSALNTNVNAYYKKSRADATPVSMSMIVQRQITPLFSGVLFTKNPVNGFDEIIVEAAEGFSERILQGGEKPVRRIYKWGQWKEKASDELPPSMKPDVFDTLIARAKQIQKAFNDPVDLEWAYSNGRIYWIQARKITTIKGKKIFSNRISGEFLPGMIKPLVWSINIPVVNSSWKRLIEEITGKTTIHINQMAHSFYYRAYFNMGIFGDIFQLFGMPRELLEIMLGIEDTGREKPSFKPGLRSLLYTHRILYFLLKRLFFTLEFERFFSRYSKLVESYKAKRLVSLSDSALIKTIDSLIATTQWDSYYNIITPLMSLFCNSFALNNALKEKGISLTDCDFSQVREKTADIQVDHHLNKLKRHYDKLPEPIQQNLMKHIKSQGSSGEAQAFIEAYRAFKEKFGHLSDSGNDFSKRPWAEDDKILIRLIREHKHSASDKKKIDLNTYSGLRRKYRKAVQYQILKERVSFLYTYGYSQFRRYFLELGSRLKNQDTLKTPDDVFYLYYDEIKRHLLDKEIPQVECLKRVKTRKAEMANLEDIEVPETIIGEETPPIIKRNTQTNRINGLGVSGGYIRGRLLHIKRLDQAGEIQPGDIVAIPYSDISWTPVFTKASGIISESGGMLSHSAIIAREFSIPAVVSAKNIFSIPEHSEVIIDGYNGKIETITG